MKNFMFAMASLALLTSGCVSMRDHSFRYEMMTPEQVFKMPNDGTLEQPSLLQHTTFEEELVSDPFLEIED